MARPLPAHPHLDWLRKSAKQELRTLRRTRPHAKLAEAQLSLAREYGFQSWRALKAHVDKLLAAGETPADDVTVGRLLRAARTGDIVTARSLLDADPPMVNATGPHPFWGGRPQALHMAIEGAQRAIFDLLLARGADVRGDNAGYSHWTPLMLAIHHERADMRSELERRGAPIGLIESLLLGDDARVAAILERGRGALPKYAPNGGSVLAFARTPFAVDRLIQLGAAKDIEDQWQTTPLQALSRLGKRGQPLVRRLLDHGLRASPAEYARLGDRATLEKLIETDPGVLRDEVLTAAVDFGHLELVRWLLSRGANPNARWNAGSRGTALHSAAWEGDLPMVKLLVEAGARTDALDEEHRATPAKFARVSVEVTGNGKCREVADYLENSARESA